MSENSLVKAARALDLIPFILSNQGISLNDLATEFDVSTEQLRDDLNMIFMCGLPGYTPLELIDLFFEDGYVTVSEPQNLTLPRKLQKGEASSILLALSFLEALPSTKITTDITVLKEKLLKSFAAVETTEIVPIESGDGTLAQIVELIEAGSFASFFYASGHSDTSAKRTVAPIQVISKDSFFYMEAWDLENDGERTFRLDRITALERVEPFAFARGLQSSQSSVLETTFLETTLLVKKEARLFIEQNLDFIERISKAESAEIVKIKGVEKDWLIRTLRGYGNQIEVLEPTSLGEELKLRVLGTLARYK